MAKRRYNRSPEAGTALAEADRLTEQKPELPLRTVILREPFEPETLLATVLELLGLG
jgi:hypothetical protein